MIDTILKSEIKLFVEKNMESCYREIAEEQYLLKPIYGLLEKWREYNRIKYMDLENENKQLKAKCQYYEIRILTLLNEINQYKAKLERTGEKLEFPVNGKDLTKIRYIIEDYFSINICRNTREQRFVYPRQLAMYFAKKYTRETESAIGFEFGRKDHATVIHSVKTIENLSRYPKTQTHLKELEPLIKNELKKL